MTTSLTRLAWEKQRTQLLVHFGYDGGRFHGLQPQPDVPTAGATLRARFVDAGVVPKALCFAARTDAGVHAIANVATCWLRAARDVDGVIAAVQKGRDDGLRSVKVQQVLMNIHARGISVAKHYRYAIEDGGPPLSPNGPQHWRVHPPLDVAAMQRAADHLIGSHDFSAFRAKRCSANTPHKTMKSITVVRDGKAVVVDIVGDAFLRQMIRIILGSLALVGARWWPPSQIAVIRDGRDRSAAGPTAPACGLTLVEVLTAPPQPS